MRISVRSSARFLSAVLALSISIPALAQPVTAVLRLKEKVSIETLAQNVRNPSSTRFAKFYKPEEIRALSAPSADEYAGLLAQLKQDGFTVVSESPTHLWLTVRAESQVFEQVFNTKIQTVGAKLRRSLYQAKAPARLSLVDAVIGLDNTRKARPLYQIKSRLTSTPGGVAQDKIKSAYGFNSIYQAGINGQGQHIAIATYDGLDVTDVQYFYNDSKLNPMSTVDVVSFNGVAKYDEGSATETELDAEFSGMMAPGVAVHVFASATNDDAGEMQMFTAILDDNRAKIVNYSWGSCETSLLPAHKDEMQKVFSRAVAQGVNIMVASGDSGSDGCGDGTTVADWPAANPNVVAVGGTTFGQNTSGKLNEVGWSGSGGGVSGVFDQPIYQQLLSGIFAKRGFPDVSFNADPVSGQAVWAHQGGKAGWMVIGGTSMAAPQWSGFMALVESARSAQGKATLGFLNPIIYGLGTAEQAAGFHDVLTGNNGAYSAGPGWDAVTGLGSMQADALLNILVKN